MPTKDIKSVTSEGAPFSDNFTAFGAAAPSELVGAFWPLLDALWEDGRLRLGAAAAVPELTAAFAAADGRRRVLIAVLLGLLAEADGADAAVRAEIRGTVGEALTQLRAHVADPAQRAGLLYLVGHFPEDAARILDTARGLALAAEESSRLARCLSVPDLADTPGMLRIGRNFPAPSVWDVADEQLPEVGGWATWLELEEEKTKLVWAMDAESLRAVDGGRALWLAQGGELAPYDPEPVPVVSEPDPADLDWPALAGPDRLGAALRCPSCHGGLAVEPAQASCAACAKTYPAGDEYVDFITDVPDIYDPFVLPAYGRGIREEFLRLVGENWGAALTLPQEDAFLREHFVPAEGPIVDIGPDNGKTTKLFADLFGVERLVVLDQSGPMLRFVRGRSHGLAALRAMCYTMPFADRSIGAINSWNVWQGASDKPALLSEVRRCLRPGGVFAFLAYRPSPNPVGRYFQQKLNIKTLDLYEPEALRAALDEAGFDVPGYAEHGSGLMLVAARARELE
jgi:SAM-dependent methyltransferase